MASAEEPKLTSLTDKAGWAGKLGPADLAQVLRYLPEVKSHPDLLVGAATYDDAGVYRLTADLAIVQTVDFFTPIVDDPFTFGQIAAANALSDIYAMGAAPLTCLNIAAFPTDKLPLHILADIIRGGSERIDAAGATLLGGHTIVDDVPKFGLAVTGVVHPDHILTNAGGQVGDVLLLTKPLGVGVTTTAMKRSTPPPEIVERVIQTMVALNKDAAEVAQQFGAHACTDITGFGFLGHLHEMAAASGLAAVVDSSQVPLLPSVLEMVAAGFICGGCRNNMAYASRYTTFSAHVAIELQWILADAVTSGGLLVAFPADQAQPAQAALAQKGVECAIVGHLRAGDAGGIMVR